MTASVPPPVEVPAHTTSPQQADPQHAAMTRLLGDARQRLVDTGTRNRLVHVNRANLRANVVNVNNTIGNGATPAATFQQVTAVGDMRQLQLGVRWSF